MKTDLEQVREAIEQAREEMAKNATGLAKLDELETAAQKRDADLIEVRQAIDEVREAAKESADELKRVREQAQRRAAEVDPVKNRRDGLRILGMMGRELLARHIGTELPQQFRGEVETLSNYREQRATIQAGATGGSYLVPTVTEREVLDTLEEVSELLNEVDFVTGLPGPMNVPTLTGRPTLQSARASVDTAMTQSDPTFGQLQFQPEEAYIYFPADNRLLQMEAVALGALLQRLLVESAIVGLADWVINADGTSSYNDITGILNESTAGYIQAMASGTSSANATAADYQAVYAKCLKRGRMRGKWLLSQTQLFQAGGIDRTGKTPLVTYTPAGQPLLLGRPVVIEEGLPDTETTASTGFGAFGDLSTYWVGLVGGMQLGTSTEYLFGKNQTAFRNVLNVDILRKPLASLILATTAAS